MDEKVFWHEAHFEALQLEFRDYLDVLSFIAEHELNKEALRMDTLIIKKIKDVEITKNIGRIFRNHNIVEYKSEKDSFSLWDYYKVMGYAYIYAAFEKINMSDVTISISLTIFPRELVKVLEKRGFTIQSYGDGIYHIHGDAVPIQILESKKLSEDENLFLRNLRSNLSSRDVRKTLEVFKGYKPNDDKNIFLDKLIKANYSAFKEVKEMQFATDEMVMETLEEWGMFTKKTEKIARNLLKAGFPVDKVAEGTELPLDTVIEIANQLQGE